MIYSTQEDVHRLYAKTMPFYISVPGAPGIKAPLILRNKYIHTLLTSKETKPRRKFRIVVSI
jgi:hypothetical protein